MLKLFMLKPGQVQIRYFTANNHYNVKNQHLYTRLKKILVMKKKKPPITACKNVLLNPGIEQTFFGCACFETLTTMLDNRNTKTIG